MTTRMYYPHQQAVARHPEKQKNCYQPIFPRRLCQNLLFDTASDVCKNQHTAILYGPCY